MHVCRLSNSSPPEGATERALNDAFRAEISRRSSRAVARVRRHVPGSAARSWGMQTSLPLAQGPSTRTWAPDDIKGSHPRSPRRVAGGEIAYGPYRVFGRPAGRGKEQYRQITAESLPAGCSTVGAMRGREICAARRTYRHPRWCSISKAEIVPVIYASDDRQAWPATRLAPPLLLGNP